MKNTILVTGAAGQLGRSVVRQLVETFGVAPSRIIATTRDPKKLAELAAAGVIVRRADFNEPATLEPAFAGADKILIISTDELDLVGGKRLRQHEEAVAAAKRAGAKQLAYTSMLAPEPGSPILFAHDHFGTEQAIRASGLPFTIFRANAYHENLLMALPAAIATGRWVTSSGAGRVAYAARDDMAAAIAAQLSSPQTESATLELTGAIAYGKADLAALVREVTGRKIEIVPVSDEALTEILKSAGVPEPFARLLASVEADVRAGHAATTNDLLELLSGRKPKTLRAFLEEHKAALLAG